MLLPVKPDWYGNNPSFSGGTVSSQEAAKGKYDWAKRFFFDFNLLYNYEDLDPQFESHNLLLEIGAGYDFGRITIKPAPQQC